LSARDEWQKLENEMLSRQEKGQAAKRAADYL